MNYCTVKREHGGKSVRHSGCGGQLAVGGTLHALTEFGIGGAPGGGVKARARYSKRVAGYSGFCLKCGESGKFDLK